MVQESKGDTGRVYDIGNRFGIGLQVEITDDVANDAKRVRVLAPLYKNKALQVPFCYAASYADHAILDDNYLVTFLINRYGV